LFSAGLPQRGDDNEGFDGFLIKDIFKELQRVKHLVSELYYYDLCNILTFIWNLPDHLFGTNHGF